MVEVCPPMFSGNNKTVRATIELTTSFLEISNPHCSAIINQSRVCLWGHAFKMVAITCFCQALQGLFNKAVCLKHGLFPYYHELSGVFIKL